MISEAKKKIVIENYFKSECDVNTSIKDAFTKGFDLGLRKAPKEPRVDFKELKRKILMEVDGGTDDTWLRCVDVRVRISNSIDEYIADMRGDEV